MHTSKINHAANMLADYHTLTHCLTSVNTQNTARKREADLAMGHRRLVELRRLQRDRKNWVRDFPPGYNH